MLMVRGVCVLMGSLLWLTCLADSVQGRVVRVMDGDTIRVQVDDHAIYPIRLSGIDAPEKTQPYGDVSRQALRQEVEGRMVLVEYNKRDKYQRLVGKVMLEGSDVNLHQIQRGLAWHYKQYAHEQAPEDRASYADAEYVAQRDQLGLWAEPSPIPPWEFRRSH